MSKRIKSESKFMLFLRVGKAKDIRASYEQKKISIGCPANWINYAKLHGNQTVGDLYECVFAHLAKDDPRIPNLLGICNQVGRASSLLYERLGDGSYLFRRRETVLTPVWCTYSFEYDELLKVRKEDGLPNVCFDLSGFQRIMGEENTGVLLIKSPVDFINEVSRQIVDAVEKNKAILDLDKFKNPFDVSASILMKSVDYFRNDDNTVFERWNKQELSELFWKRRSYNYQSEARLEVSKVNFKSDSVDFGMDYKVNTLDVYLPNFQSYTEIYRTGCADKLYFTDFREAERACKFCISDKFGNVIQADKF